MNGIGNNFWTVHNDIWAFSALPGDKTGTMGHTLRHGSDDLNRYHLIVS